MSLRTSGEKKALYETHLVFLLGWRYYKEREGWAGGVQPSLGGGGGATKIDEVRKGGRGEGGAARAECQCEG